MSRVSRREFLKVSSLSVLALSLNTLRLHEVKAQEHVAGYPYRGWEDLYKRQWTWDRVVKGTHAMTNCRADCTWDLFIKDGIVWREEQSCTYPDPPSPQLVDFNPSGCQKGASFSHVMYAPNRIKYPLKRVGKRGEGKWQRVSWDQALEEIAEKFVQVIKEHGCETIQCDTGGTNGAGIELTGLARFRFFDLIGSPIFDGFTDMTDLNYGAALTYGQAHVDGTADDCLNSDYIMIWTMNPACTHIPYMHFITEARYNGATVVCVAPDYSPSSIHADLWIPVAPGTDAALALAMARFIIENKLYHAPHLKEQTDLPFLVRDDTKKFLREKDLEPGGKAEVFYFWDLKNNRLQKVPGSKDSDKYTLVLGGIDPALEGSWEVELASGKKVILRPVFEILKKILQPYTPEKASQIIKGVGPELIKGIAQEFARARSAMILSSWGSNKNYHSDLINRAKCLLLALCGHIGKPGSGFRTSTFLWPEEFLKLLFPTSLTKGWAPRVVNHTLFYKYHCGLQDILGKEEWSDKRYMKRSMEAYIQESLEKGWMTLVPPKGKSPRIWWEMGGNILRRQRAYDRYLEYLWPQLELVVTVDFRWNNTARYSDFVLPAASQYEKTCMKYQISYSPYFAFQEKAVEPLYESKHEWEIMARLAKKIQEKAAENNFTKYRDPIYQRDKDLGTFYDEFTLGGKIPPDADIDRYFQEMFDKSTTTRGAKVGELKRKGFFPLQSAGSWTYPSGKAFVGPFNPFGLTSPLKEGQAITPFLYYTEGKKPWPTLTGRQQFYIDHDWFLEFEEELPVHKDPPKVGGDYPFIISGGHTRWSIHGIWRDNYLLLRLQRGIPVMYLNEKDALSMGIRDHELVRVKNDVGSFMINVKISPSVRPGVVIVYHAWDPYQHIGNRNQQVVMPGAMKAVHLVGGYGQIFLAFAHCGPALTMRETRVKIEKV